jgi:hypothetical protein
MPLYEARFNPASLKSFLFNLAQPKISRLMYFPPIASHLEHGGVLYFNQISSTKLKAFGLANVQKVGAVSAFGMFEVDKMLESHLLRAKEEDLSFTIH